MTSFGRNSNYELMRSPIARSMRGPLMGRAITRASSDSKETSASDEEDLIQLAKRRYGWIAANRRKWMGLKRRRGPLFG